MFIRNTIQPDAFISSLNPTVVNTDKIVAIGTRKGKNKEFETVVKFPDFCIIVAAGSEKYCQDQAEALADQLQKGDDSPLHFSHE